MQTVSCCRPRGRPWGRRGRGHAPARRALQVALLDQVRLEHVFNRVALFADGGGQVVDTDRPAVELMQDRFEQLAVHQVEADRIDIEHRQRGVSHFARDDAIGLDLGVIAHAAQQAVGDTRCAARALGDLQCAVFGDLGVEQASRARDDLRQLGGRVELQPRDDAEAVAQRVGQHAGARGGAHQCERLQIELDRARRRALADHDVDLVVLQRRIQDFLHHGREPVDLVDEEDVVGFEVGEQRGQVARALQHGAGGLAQVDPHLARDDVRQRRLAQARRAEQQHVVERFAAVLGRRHEDVELAAHLFLADVFVEQLGAQRALEGLLVGGGGGR